jgi:hypothetical protein
MARKQHGGVAPTALAGLSAQDTTITASEDDNITIDPRGTGLFEIKGNQRINDAGELRFGDTDSSNYVAFKAAGTVSSNVTWTLPTADATTANQSLVSDGAGTLSFVTTGAQITDDTTDSSPEYLIFGTATSGTLLNVSTSSTKLTYTPSTGEINCDALLVDGTARFLVTENTYTASHGLALADRNKVVNMNNSASATVTVEADATTNFPIGSVLYVNRTGAGTVALQGAAGVTLSRSGTLSPNEEIYIRKRSANSWIVVDSPTSLSASGGTVSAGGGFTIHTYSSTGAATFVVG